MQIDIPDLHEFQAQAVTAGYASVEDYVITLLTRDGERLAIQQGIDEMRAGQTRPFEEFDQELRREFRFGSRKS